MPSVFEGTVEVYARIGASAKELGKSQQELLDFTLSLNKAVALSGASSIEARNALILFQLTWITSHSEKLSQIFLSANIFFVHALIPKNVLFASKPFVGEISHGWYF